MATTMTTQTLADLEAIRLLKSRYFRALDLNDWQWVRSSMVANLDFDHPTIGAHPDADTAVAAIAASVVGIKTVHLGHDPDIEFTGRDEATGHWTLQSFSYTAWGYPGISNYAVYNDRFVRVDGEWKFAAVQLVYLYRGAEAARGFDQA
jgi:hypothetical protein